MYYRSEILEHITLKEMIVGIAQTLTVRESQYRGVYRRIQREYRKRYDKRYAEKVAVSGKIHTIVFLFHIGLFSLDNRA